MPTNWWFTKSNVNMLQGVEGDIANPPKMPLTTIAYCLRTSRQARYDYNKLYPNLTILEQERLDNLIADNPRATSLQSDETAVNDQFQHTMVSQPKPPIGPFGRR